ncbi:MAG: hypothetical protein ACM3JC_16765 [Rudaea sp.]
MPESLAACLDAAGSLAPFARAPGRSKALAEAGIIDEAKPASPPRSAVRHATVSDGEEIIADDAVPPGHTAHESLDVADAAHVADVDGGDSSIGGAPVARSDAGEEPTEDAPQLPPIVGPDAADRPAARVARGNPLHPVAWAVVLAALGGAAYYAHVERTQWMPWLAEVTALVGGSRPAPDVSVAPARDGTGATTTTPAASGAAPGGMTTGLAEHPAENASPPGVAAGTNADPAATHEAPANVSPGVTDAASGDAATARRAAGSSHAPVVTRPAASATPVAPATRNATAPAASTTAKSVAPKGGAANAAASKAATPKRDDAAKAADTTKPANADAVATRRLIERELGDFLPPDAKRSPPDVSPGN